MLTADVHIVQYGTGNGFE